MTGVEGGGAVTGRALTDPEPALPPASSAVRGRRVVLRGRQGAGSCTYGRVEW